MPSDDAASSKGGSGTCPDTGQLAALLGDAAHEPPSEMAGHIEGCPACQRRLGELAGHGDWLEPLASGDAVTRSAVRAAQHDEPTLRALIQELSRRPHAASPGASVHDGDLGFLAPTDLPGYIGQLGPYQVIEVVGRGGMGIVLKAHDPSLARIVAIKVMAPVLAASQTARKRFVREARAAAAISHENVVTIHAVDESNGLPYIVMQFVAGRSLDARIRDAGGPLPTEEVLRIGTQAALGLAAAHARGLVHRDVKPANIMLEDGTQRVKLTDFGLAHAADDASVTMTGQVSGTPSFMAPEQARGERVDARADLFSLGCVMYAMCAGRPPFAAPTPLAALRAVCDDDPPPLAEVNPDVPAWLAELVHRLLRKDPAQRPASARDVADVLAGLAGRAPSSSSGVHSAADAGRGLPRPRRVAVLLGAAAILCIGLLALAEMTGITHLTSRLRGTAVAHAPADGVGPAASAPSASSTRDAPAEAEAVVLLAAGEGGGPRAFASLAEAVAAAQPGDTIELRHNGPVTTPRVDVGRKALRLRAGAGFRPALMQAGDGQAILTSAGPLVLEGLTLEGLATVNAPPARGDDPGECLLVASGGPVHVANCRFVVRSVPEARFGALRVSGSAACEIVNSELYAVQGMGVQWFDVPAAGGSRLRLDNVIATGRFGLVLDGRSPGRGEISIQGSTFVVQAFVNLRPGFEVPSGLAVKADRSVVVTSAVRFDMSSTRREDRFAAVAWTDGQMIYNMIRRMPGPHASPDVTADPDGDTPRPVATEADVRFAREFRRPQALLDEPPEPGDFALQAVRFSNGRMAQRRVLENVGANTGLVGPGPAYDAFLNSSAYAIWQVQTDDALRQAR